MNALPLTLPNLQRAPADPATSPSRRERREREFGTGYGNSSGYAGTRRYVQDAGLHRFRFG